MKKTASVASLVSCAALLTGSLMGAAPASATMLDCAGQTFTSDTSCTVQPGETLTYTIKGGNGGSGGQGGRGGSGGNFDGAFVISNGGLGGLGGAGGTGGGGALVSGPYTNNTGDVVVLDVVVGSNGAAGADGADGANGAFGSLLLAMPATDGIAGDGADDGTSGASSSLAVSGQAAFVVAGYGYGGQGGHGGQGGTAASDGTDGVNGLDGSDGTSGVGGDLSNSTVPADATIEASGSGIAPAVVFSASSLPTPPSTPAIDTVVAAQQFTLTLDGNGGTCATSSISGDSGSWVALPGASACARDGYALTGWSTAAATYDAGASVQLTGDNTLMAVWTNTTGTSPDPTKPVDTSPTNQTLHQVIWKFTDRGIARLATGAPATLRGENAFFTIACKDASQVTDMMIAQAAMLADLYGGTYGGLAPADSWKKPRLVASFMS